MFSFRNEPSLELLSVLKRYPRKVTCLTGRLMFPKDLERVQISDADAVSYIKIWYTESNFKQSINTR